MQTYENIQGNTFPVKEKIKALGGRWNALKKCWQVPSQKVREANAIVAAGGVSAPRRSSFAGSASDDLKLAQRGMIRVNGPNGSYVRKATREELYDEL